MSRIACERLWLSHLCILALPSALGDKMGICGILFLKMLSGKAGLHDIALVKHGVVWSPSGLPEPFVVLRDRIREGSRDAGRVAVHSVKIMYNKSKFNRSYSSSHLGHKMHWIDPDVVGCLYQALIDVEMYACDGGITTRAAVLAAALARKLPTSTRIPMGRFPLLTV